jgi:hypothetical protein
MQRKKIFWLDDHPDILATSYIKEFSNGKVSADQLLEKTVFAYDFEMGREILASGEYQFDLHIMDGDFPRVMEQVQVQRVDKFLQKLRTGGKRPCLEDGFKGQYYNAFVEFCLDHLLNKEFVVHSMSRDAERLSFLLGWEFYGKGDRSKEDPPFDLEGEFWHNDFVGQVPKKVFDKIYESIKSSPRWKPVEEVPNHYRLNDPQKQYQDWVYGGADELIIDRIVPLFKDK